MIVKRQPFDFARYCEEMARRLPCQHPHTAPCKRIKANTGVPFYRRQCPDCGAALSSQLKFSDVEAFLARGGTLGTWSEEGYWGWIASRKKASQEVKQAFGWDYDSFWERYTAYLLSDEWQHLRLRILKRDGHRCRKCLKNPARQVHHETYARAGHELDDDLTSICVPCHQAIHPHRVIGAALTPGYSKVNSYSNSGFNPSCI